MVIRERLAEGHHSVVWLSERLGCSRTAVYNLFRKKAVSTDELMRISITLDCDLFKLYSCELGRRNNKNDS